MAFETYSINKKYSIIAARLTKLYNFRKQGYSRLKEQHRRTTYPQ